MSGTTYAVFALLVLAGGALAVWPLLRRVPWPAERADGQDDVARAVSSLRDLEFARAAGTIAPEDHARLRDALEREALAPPRSAAATVPGAPAQSVVVAALLAGIAVMLVAVALPREVGDRAATGLITGSLPDGAPSIATLESRVAASPRDIPTRLALADAYVQAGRSGDAANAYRAVLEIDRDNVPALNGIALLLDLAGERDAALIAVQRVLQLRPRDGDALFLQGLIAYKKNEWRTAVDTWRVFLEVGEFHPAAEMVRPLYRTAERNLANR